MQFTFTFINNDGSNKWPSDKANYSCEMLCKLLYIIQVDDKQFNFLALLDVEVFDHLSRLTVVSCMTKKNSPRDDYREYFTHTNSVKNES